MPREYIPIDIDESLIRDDPDIIIPIKYLIKQVKIQEDDIYFKKIEGDEILDGERIVVIKKSRDKESEKKRKNYTINNQDDMFVTNEKELLSFSEILEEKCLIEVIHTKEI